MQSWLSKRVGRLDCHRHFHTSPIASHRWQPKEDARLLAQYEKYGPAWSLVKHGLNKRKPLECRTHWLKISGTLDAHPPNEQALLLAGYERHGDRWIRFPVEDASHSPLARLAALLPVFRHSWQKKKSGWPKLEQLAVREGYEMYGAQSDPWNRTASMLNRRTGVQCYNFMARRFAMHNGLPEDDAAARASGQ